MAPGAAELTIKQRQLAFELSCNPEEWFKRISKDCEHGMSCDDLARILQRTSLEFDGDWDLNGDGWVSLKEFFTAGGMRDSILEALGITEPTAAGRKKLSVIAVHRRRTRRYDSMFREEEAEGIVEEADGSPHRGATRSDGDWIHLRGEQWTPSCDAGAIGRLSPRALSPQQERADAGTAPGPMRLPPGAATQQAQAEADSPVIGKVVLPDFNSQETQADAPIVGKVALPDFSSQETRGATPVVGKLALPDSNSQHAQAPPRARRQGFDEPAAEETDAGGRERSVLVELGSPEPTLGPGASDAGDEGQASGDEGEPGDAEDSEDRLLVCPPVAEPESETQRLERVLHWTVEQLASEGIAVPTEIARDPDMQVAPPSKCQVYRFGNRRLHLYVRGAGTLPASHVLHVRVGGGYIDFASFCRKRQRRRRAPGPDATDAGDDDEGAVDDAEDKLLVCPPAPAPETDAQRLERVLAWTLGQLESEAVPLPPDIAKDQDAPLPPGSVCHVYRFGTRRLHLHVRRVDANSHLLLVRTGGGYTDFAAFCRRHGRVEQSKCLRQSSRKD